MSNLDIFLLGMAVGSLGGMIASVLGKLAAHRGVPASSSEEKV